MGIYRVDEWRVCGERNLSRQSTYTTSVEVLCHVLLAPVIILGYMWRRSDMHGVYKNGKILSVIRARVNFNRQK